MLIIPVNNVFKVFKYILCHVRTVGHSGAELNRLKINNADNYVILKFKI